MQPANKVAANESAIKKVIRFVRDIFVSMLRQSARRAMSVSRRRCSFRGQCSRSVLLACARQFFNEIEDGGHEEDSDKAGGKHSADHSSAHDLTRDGTGARRSPERNASEDEGKRSHQDRPKTEPGAFQSGVGQRLALFGLLLGELDDQNGVFGGEANEHNQADLRVNIGFDLLQVWRIKNTDKKAP